MLMKSALMLGFATALSGCGGTQFKMQGNNEGGSETFSGNFMRHFDGTGSLQVRSSKGRTCIGKVVYSKRGERTANGTITCSDGQSGPIELQEVDFQGNGSGRIGSEPITFTFTI